MKDIQVSTKIYPNGLARIIVREKKLTYVRDLTRTKENQVIFASVTLLILSIPALIGYILALLFGEGVAFIVLLSCIFVVEGVILRKRNSK